MASIPPQTQILLQCQVFDGANSISTQTFDLFMPYAPLIVKPLNGQSTISVPVSLRLSGSVSVGVRATHAQLTNGFEDYNFIWTCNGVVDGCIDVKQANPLAFSNSGIFRNANTHSITMPTRRLKTGSVVILTCRVVVREFGLNFGQVTLTGQTQISLIASEVGTPSIQGRVELLQGGRGFYAIYINMDGASSSLRFDGTESFRLIESNNGPLSDADLSALQISTSPTSIAAVCQKEACVEKVGSRTDMEVVFDTVWQQAALRFSVAKVNQFIPTGGTCTCIGSGGVALSQSFSIECSGWRTSTVNGASLVTELSLLSPVSGRVMLVSGIGSLSFSLPYQPNGVPVNFMLTSTDSSSGGSASLVSGDVDSALPRCVFEVSQPAQEDGLFGEQLIRDIKSGLVYQTPASEMLALTSFLTTVNNNQATFSPIEPLVNTIGAPLVLDTFLDDVYNDVTIVGAAYSQILSVIQGLATKENVDWLDSFPASIRSTAMSEMVNVTLDVCLAMNENIGEGSPISDFLAKADAIEDTLFILDALLAYDSNLLVEFVVKCIQDALVGDSVCGASPYIGIGDQLSVYISNDFLGRIIDQPQTAGTNNSAVFVLTPEVIEGLADGDTCATVVLSTQSGGVGDEDGRLPAQELTIFVNGTAQSIEGLSDNAVLITMPIPENFEIQDDNSACSSDDEDDSPQCQVLDEISLEWSNRGCQYVEELSNDTHVVCACSHLSTFSALFPSGSDGECWGWIQITSITLMGAAFVLVVLFILIVIYVPGASLFFEGEEAERVRKLRHHTRNRVPSSSQGHLLSHD